MDEEVTTRFWISFFVEAGIPPAAAANYAIIFTDNRIQKHMLLDLNKEYLKDMGVTVLGDIIAILKHAKSHHEKVAREKVLAADKAVSVQRATKHLNEILSKDDSTVMIPSPVQQPVVKPPKMTKPSPPKKMKLVKTETGREIDEDAWHAEVEELKRKVIPPSNKIANKVNSKSNTAVVSTLKKSSVFERLGESSVTSTTPDAPSTSVKSSVFRRLGNISLKVTSEPPPASLSTSSVKLTTRPVVPPTANQIRITLEAKKPSMRMDSVSTPIAKKSARERLGLDRNPSPSRTVTKQTTSTINNQQVYNQIKDSKLNVLLK